MITAAGRCVHKLRAIGTEALTELARVDEPLAKIVELRFFGGLTNQEIAETLAVSVSTVERQFRVARAWLRVRLTSPRSKPAC